MSNILVDSVLTVLTSRVVWKRCAYTEPVAVGRNEKKNKFSFGCAVCYEELRGAHNHSSGSLLCTKDHQGRCKQELEALLPFCRQFYGAANRHDWTDDAGDDHIDHDVLQAEGEEQGVMPALYGAQHAAVADVRSQVRPWLLSWTTRTSGFPPERVAPLFGAPSDPLGPCPSLAQPGQNPRLESRWRGSPRICQQFDPSRAAKFG